MRNLKAEEKAHRLELYDQGLSDSAIASLLGISRPSVSKWRKWNNLPPNVLQGNPHCQFDQIRFLIWQGVSDGEIIKRLGLRLEDRGLVINHRLRLGFPGFQNRRWTDREKAIACRLYVEGYTGPEVAKALHRTKGAIYMMLRKVDRFKLAKQVRWGECEPYLANLGEDE